MNLSTPAALVAACLLALPSLAAAFDWNNVADEDTVVVLTTDEDGSPRETTVWLVVVDGQGYIRTGETSWGGNVLLEPHVVLRIGSEERACDVVFVTEEGAREQIEAAFRAKYGFQDAFVGFFFHGGTPQIMKLVPAS